MDEQYANNDAQDAHQGLGPLLLAQLLRRVTGRRVKALQAEADVSQGRRSAQPATWNSLDESDEYQEQPDSDHAGNLSGGHGSFWLSVFIPS